MKAARSLRLLAVYEFAGQRGHMMDSLLDSLRAELPGLKVSSISGLFPVYRPGGLRPQRVANLAWVYLRVAARLVASRPSAVLVHSAPPGVQLWTVLWASLRRVPVFFWLMDYHPELEARLLERRGLGLAARLLRAVDSRLMPRFSVIITLDGAMSALARTRSGSAEVLEHPTWGEAAAGGLAPVSYRPGGSPGPLRLAYSGNLGVAHDLAPLRALLAELVRRRPVALLVIGASAAGEGRFRELARELGFTVEAHPRVPFGGLRPLYEERRIDAGIVLLAAESGGLVSPSKFSGYINFGLPLVYLGPAATNTALVCVRFAGGFWLPTGSGPDAVRQVAEDLLDRGRLEAAAAGARAAAAYFAGIDGRSLARALAPRLERCEPRG
jgi:hypothetical protein